MTTALPQQLSADLDRLAADEQRRGRAPSLLLAVGRSGVRRQLCTAGGNPEPTADTQYRIGSITKTFTATLVMQLRDEGRLGLDDRLEQHLPGTPVGALRVRQMLSHVSGLQAEPDGPWWERSPGVPVDALLAGLTAGKVSLPPGRWRHYSNLAFALLGAMVERVTGERWFDRVQYRILDPLGLRRTSYTAHDPAAGGWLVHPWQETMRAEPTHDSGAMAPAGQLWSTADDLLRWGRVLGAGADGVLAADTAAEMRAPVAMVDPDSWTLASGLGLALPRVGDRVYCGHSGSMPGFVSCLAVHPATGWSTVSFANCYDGAEVTSLAHRALGAVLDAMPEPPKAWAPADPPPADIAPLTGRWWWMGTELTAGYDPARRQLVLRSAYDDEGDTSYFEPAGADRWRCVDGLERGEDLYVERDAAGVVTALVVRTFVFVRDPWPADPR